MFFKVQALGQDFCRAIMIDHASVMVNLKTGPFNPIACNGLEDLVSLIKSVRALVPVDEHRKAARASAPTRASTRSRSRC